MQVAWVHYGAHGSAVLTVGTHVLTVNPRVSVTEERNTWTLYMKNVTKSDEGDYMCQVSTVPPSKLYGHLTVVGKYSILIYRLVSIFLYL